MTCVSPRCTNDADPYASNTGLFCPDHASILARVRDEIQAEALTMASWRNGLKRTQRKPECCWLGCTEYRAAGEAFCALHQDEAMEVLDAA
jgi:hypothetical protein